MSLNAALEYCIKGDPEKSFEILSKMDSPEAKFNLGWHEMRKGNLLKGMEGLAFGRWLNVFGSPPVKTDKPIWRDQDLRGKKLLLNGEGGFGDEIINVRFAENFKRMGANVTVSCSRPLMPLFRTMPFIDCLVSSPEASDHDYWVPAMSAPLVLGLEYPDLSGKPYIPIESRAGGLKIGLKFSGNPKFEHEQHRLFPAELMTALQRDDAEFYSLQKENIPELGKIKDLSPEMGDWLRTAEIISGLDLVITSCTAIAHLSGAMGKRTWVIVPIMSYYIWSLPGNKSPWYDTVKIYRQETYGCWKKPFERIRSDLNDLCQGKERRGGEVSLHRKRA